MKLTYCNPLCIENIPEGRCLDAYITEVDPRTLNDYLSIYARNADLTL